MERRAGLLGVGIYTVAEAERLARVSAPRIRRWMRGYQFRVRAATHASPPVWKPDLPEMDGALALSFRDLIEVRFVDYFLQHGVSWKVLRQAAQAAADIVEDTHPFSTRRFKTDGKRIFTELGKTPGTRKLLDVVARQYAMETVLASRLYEGLEFDRNHPTRWFPMPHRRVVVDPAVAFGQPVTSPDGVPTAILAKAVQVEDDLDRVAAWYMVPRRAVQDAVDYEVQLAA